MKALTIEELKALKVDDWIWVIIQQDLYRPNNVPYGGYYKIVSTLNINYLVIEFDRFYYNKAYSTYGTKWVAYKNKEQAENKKEE